MSGVLIVGAGLAGARCAEVLRAEGFDGPITLVGSEPTAPYERPALSKEVLLGAREPEQVALRPDQWWEEQGIELHRGVMVDAVDVPRRLASVGGEPLRWDHLVLATGARPRRLPGLPPSAHVLRTLGDALALREQLVPGAKLVVVGAGLIGAEVASAALSLGCEVTLVDAASAPLLAAVGPEVGAILAMRWERLGAELHLDAPIERAGRGELELAGGIRLPYDVLLVAIGAEPVGELLGGGEVPTDDCGRTALPDVYACGDAAAFGRPRVEHWTAASGQGTAVARAIVGRPVPYGDLPYFWSDQFGLRLQVVGDRSGAATAQLDGEPDSFTCRYLDEEGTPVAILLANRAADVAAARRELAAAA